MLNLSDCNETQLNASSVLQRNGFHVNQITHARVAGRCSTPQRVIKMSRTKGIVTRRVTICESGKVNGMSPQSFLDKCSRHN